MDEKILAKSEQCNVKKILKIMCLAGAVLTIILFLIFFTDRFTLELDNYDYNYETYAEHYQSRDCAFYIDTGYGWECYSCEAIAEHPNKFEYAVSEAFKYDMLPFSVIPLIALSLIGVLCYFWLRSYELTITDKRIYGSTAWGNRVDLPVDSVSAVATIRRWKGISIATSSGKISFLLIKNADELYSIVNNLLIERQREKNNASASVPVPATDEADQLKKYKDLLDTGVITQEEFDAKKKQLLGL